MKKAHVLENKKKLIIAAEQLWSDLATQAYVSTKGKYTLPISIDTFQVKNDDYNTLKYKISLVIGALTRLVSDYTDSKLIQDLLMLSSYEHNIVTQSSELELEGLVRVDMFWADKPKIVEVNSDFPDGFLLHDKTESIIRKLNNFSQSSISHEEILKSHIMKHISGGKIISVHEDGRLFTDEFHLLNNFLDKNFIHSVMSISDYSKEIEADFIRRGLELYKLERSKKELTYLLKRKVQMLNNFKIKLLGNKGLMALLHLSDIRSMFSEKVLSVIDELIPKTYFLNKETICFAKKNKNKFVVKPINLAEGECVLLGVSTNIKEWNNKLDDALEGSYRWVIQEKVEIPSTTFRIVDDRGIYSEITANYDFNPHFSILNGVIKSGKVLVRFSSEEILNVMKGGGITYCLID